MKILIELHLLLIKEIFFLNKTSLDNNISFYEDDPDTNIHARFSALCSKLEKRKALQKR